MTPVSQDAATADAEAPFNVTQVERDRGVFQYRPAQRRAHRAEIFSRRPGGHPRRRGRETMAQVQLGKTLPPEEINLIVQFLRSLTGELPGRPLAAPAPERADGRVAQTRYPSSRCSALLTVVWWQSRGAGCHLGNALARSVFAV
ncbi:MAG: hypothetical protein IPI57_12850 [Candidatus Competibacteraceae bacterium]|nr:hypothetical protein [Candidatus Competibacteraceae bacterium]